MPGQEQVRQHGPLEQFVTAYIDRVVNRQDVTAVDDMVSPGYTGQGPDWPSTLAELRQFYLDQMRDRPDWHIDVQDAVELGDSVVVRALASGTVTVEGVARRKRLEWLTHYRVVDRLIAEINIMEVVPLGWE